MRGRLRDMADNLATTNRAKTKIERSGHPSYAYAEWNIKNGPAYYERNGSIVCCDNILQQAELPVFSLPCFRVRNKYYENKFFYRYARHIFIMFLKISERDCSTAGDGNGTLCDIRGSTESTCRSKNSLTPSVRVSPSHISTDTVHSAL